MKINRKTIVLLTIVLLLFISALFVVSKGKKTNSNQSIAEENVFDCNGIDYSRLSFFNASKDRMSLNIPDIWEGNYRVKESGDKAIFYYLSKDGKTTEIFDIYKKENVNRDERVICQKGNLKFILKIIDGRLSEEQNKMIKFLECMMKSAKCY